MRVKSPRVLEVCTKKAQQVCIVIGTTSGGIKEQKVALFIIVKESKQGGDIRVNIYL